MLFVPDQITAPPAAAGRSAAGGALLAALAMLSAGLLAWQAVAPAPARFAGLTVDRLSAMLTLLVACVGLVTHRFAVRYLDGDPRRGRFLACLVGTVAAAYALMLASNLVVLFAAWTLASVGLHALLMHYPGRAEARRAARKKFLISRVGDVALLGAIAVAWTYWRTLDLDVIVSLADAGVGTDGVAPIAMFVVLAALTKSAQFPFHSWLPETMETPTPVSALMHAGVINAGGALLLRFAPLLVQVPSAMLTLVVVGTLTASLGVVAMWAQVKVKRTLAWSTVAQMGFMMIQCGLGAFAAAALHVVAHGCYKAWSFLRCGELPPTAPTALPLHTAAALTLTATGVAVAVPAMWLASRATGFTPLHAPGELALCGVLALSAGQVWAAILGRPGVGRAAGVGLAAAVTLGGAVVAFALYRAAAAFLAPVIGGAAAPLGPLAWLAAAVPVAAFASLTVLHAMLPTIGRWPWGRALHVHALHGFYFGAIADRAVALVWPADASRRPSADIQPSHSAAPLASRP